MKGLKTERDSKDRNALKSWEKNKKSLNSNIRDFEKALSHIILAKIKIIVMFCYSFIIHFNVLLIIREILC